MSYFVIRWMFSGFSSRSREERDDIGVVETSEKSEAQRNVTVAISCNWHCRMIYTDD